MSSEPGQPQVRCRLEELLGQRNLTMTDLSRRTGITMANLSILKNNKAKAVRMTTIAALCAALNVTPGDLFVLGEGSRAVGHQAE